ncbi:transposase [Streptomyces sp. NPDC051104]|uniref:transposase n=1 Tax=Streptomyces sp. NPDC051104 TaxID=3155044 RepID=UPI003426246E
MFGRAPVNRDEVDAARPARHLVGTGSPRRFDVPVRDVTSDGRVKLNPRSLRRHRYERSCEAGRECQQLLRNHDLQSLSGAAGCASEASRTASPARLESSTRLGRHRWTIERTMSRLGDCRRLHRRCERKAEHFLDDQFQGVSGRTR